MRYYIITGEKSGELHAVNLIRELKKLDNNSVFKGWGGDLMKSEGVEITVHISRLGIMGIFEVIKKLFFILKIYRSTTSDIINFKPDAIILVDFPGLNLKFAKNLSKKGFNVFYYISPTVWAWNRARIKIIKKYVKKLFVILPFEKEFYEKFNIKVEYEGHPLVDEIEKYISNCNKKNFFKENNIPEDKEIIALLPGSRLFEIKYSLPVMKKLAKEFKQFNFIIAGIQEIDKTIYNKFLSDNIYLVINKTYDLLANSKAAIVNSGTATLEAALFNVPQIVCYKLNPLSYFIGKLLVRVKYISLVNLILNKRSIAELIQNEFNVKNLKKEFEKILNDDVRSEILADYLKLKNMLNKNGVSRNIAIKIYNEIKNY